MLKPKLAVTDDHAMVRDGISNMLVSSGYEVIHQCANGKELLNAFVEGIPDIVLMDINMPEMDGYETTNHLRKHFPEVKVIALSMLDTDMALIRMIRAGAKSFVLKSSPVTELELAIEEVMRSGFYFTEFISERLLESSSGSSVSKAQAVMDQFSKRELEFLNHACTEMTYREIADKMCVSHRSVDGYRDSLFQKLNVKSRVGLAVFAVKHGLVSV